VDERYVDVDGLRIRVLTAGAGRPLLYLHGTGDGGTWRPPLGQLSAQWRVIRPDHPGFIESDALPDESVAGIAALYSRMFDVLQLDDVTVIGASLGGWIATELALLEPQRVSRLIVVDPAGMLYPDEPVGDMFVLSAVETAERMFPAGPLRDAAVEQARQPARPGDPLAARRDRSAQAAQRIAADPYMSDPTLPARARALVMPVTIVWGEEDRIHPLVHSRLWTQALPGADLHVIPHAGHGPQNQRPDAFLEATGLLA
jgi:pimeloyl-ACP methyl ester carboxylesterase